LSERKIAKQLNVSRNTVSKYLNMSEDSITSAQGVTERSKKLDAYRPYIVQILQSFPALSAAKVFTKLKEKVALEVSDRSMRRYIQKLKQEVCFKQPRYYEPVIDMIPGQQCQVDGGELRGVMIGGIATTVYMTVFVLSYSRLMHVSVSAQPLNTETLIQHHDAAFRYFGGRPEECVYDQTKLVVIQEEFRELTLNQRFHQYATAVGFTIRACEGYDPESKGKVEAGVKYVKHNGLYGEVFECWSDLERYVAHWLETIANQRLHGTTGQKPTLYYQEAELPAMYPYLSPSCLQANESVESVTRKVDKTGLIAWQSNKYSVPMAYQGTRIGVRETAEQLLLIDRETGKTMAEHTLCREKGQIIKNRHHYRDPEQQVAQLESELKTLLNNADWVAELCALLKRSAPTIYKDQLRGAQQVMTDYLQCYGDIKPDVMKRVIDTSRLTVTGLRERLTAYHAHPERAQAVNPPNIHPVMPALAQYAALNDPSDGQGVSHVDRP
jgi:transposase